jgi:hypothetical protein
MRRYRFPADGDVLADLRETHRYTGDLAAIYAGHRGALVHKWHHYLPLYERYFGPWRGRSLRFLEIGVSKGGSLAMWRDWFGPDATIYGIDINPACAALDGQAAQVRIGSQADPAFLEKVVTEMGGVDLVLDDGSHQMEHVRASFEALFPRLTVGGVYMIEDLHTAYWPRYGGGIDAPENFFRYVSGMVDDMHRWYHRGPARHPEVAPWVTGLHLHDSVVAIDKAVVHRPTHSRVG